MSSAVAIPETMFSLRRFGISGAVRRFSGHGGFAYLGSFRKTVADVGVGEQVLGVRRVVLNLLAQLADKGTQVIDFLAVVRAPDRSEQLAIGDRAAGMGHQVVEDVVFLAREVNRLAGAVDDAPGREHLNLADGKRRILRPEEGCRAK